MSHNLAVQGAFGYVPPAVGASEPEFTMGSDSSYATSTVTIGDNTYLTFDNPTSDAYYKDYYDTSTSYATTTLYTNLTLSETTIYCPVVQIIQSDGTDQHAQNATWYSFFPVFSTAITIVDGLNTYGSITTELPSALSVCGKIVDGAEIECTAQDAFDYGSGASDGSATPQVANNILVYSSALNSTAKDAYTVFVKYKYKALSGNTYYYYVCYYAPKQTIACVTAETLITLADGTQKMAKDLTGNEQLLTLNHTTGKLEATKIAYIVNHGEYANFKIIKLNFSNGSSVEMYAEHVFYDVTLNKYVAINTNPEQYVGHEFIALAGTSMQTVTLESVTYETKYTSLYEVVTYQHLTCFTENILSTSAYLDKLLNIFEIEQDTFAYNPQKVAEDIQTYGTYAYEDFKDLISEEAFELYNAKYLKIAVGKGYITWQDILDLIDIYFNVDVKPLS